jgi:hypothetical protein
MLVLNLLLTVRERFSRLKRDDRGDVPGWVMVTVMTAALVAALLAVAAPTLTSAFTSAISKIAG